MSANTSTTSSPGGMDKWLLQAAISGDSTSMKAMVDSLDQSILLRKTPSGTPLVIAAALGHTSLASLLLGRCRELGLSLAISQQDQHGLNALDHAIRNGHQGLALELIAAEPALSRGESKRDESPMFAAVMRGFTDVFEKLLEIPGSADVGVGHKGRNALHAAAMKGYSVIAAKIMERRPQLATKADTNGITPIRLAVIYNKVDVLRVLLEHDSSLGFEVDKIGFPLLCCAADQGQVDAARELLKHFPDVLYRNTNAEGWTCLHVAVQRGHREFVEFILRTPRLEKLVNMQDSEGKTALHYAVQRRDPGLVAALLSHKNIDTTTLDNHGNSAASQLSSIAGHEDWTEVRVLMWKLNTSTRTSSPGGIMDKGLLKAATSGDSVSMKRYACHVPSILLGTTPQGNTCLHISSAHGHERFCHYVVALEESLLASVNSDKETPLVAAVRSSRGNSSLASVLLGHCRSRHLSNAILRQDKDGCNALHHAVRSGHEPLAMELIEAEPALSRAVNKYNESPMFIAAMRNFTLIFKKLLQTPGSSHAGPHDQNALHAAALNGDKENTAKIMTIRPEMARAADKYGNTPVRQAVIHNKADLLRVLLEHDSSLGYEVSKQGYTLLTSAAFRGHVDVAREILDNCPDAPYYRVDDKHWTTCLHTAISRNHQEFVEFILATPQLRKLVNTQDSQGRTALHLAVQMCNPKTVAALLSHEDIDVAVLDSRAISAAWQLGRTKNQAKTLNWNEVSMLMLRAHPQQPTSLYNLLKLTKQDAADASRKDAKSLTQTYTSNTSLVAILIATITFTAAFTLPGGYSSASGSEGLPIMSKKFAFRAFLISDVLAMCSSFAVAFICIIARWEDYEFLLYYRSFTKKLMWFAYVATTTAFSTGLYTVLAPHLHWLAIVICVLVALLPILTKLLGEWPVLKLRFRLGKAFKSDLLDMV